MNQLLIPLKVNTAMTRKVIAFHARGYTYDFSVTHDHRIVCIQDERLFTIEQVMLTLIDQRYDEITSCYKYLHLVETCCGDKGILVDCRPWVNAMFTNRPQLASRQYTSMMIPGSINRL
jgi:hypothetical protein